jgi:hypothetical protein
MINKLIVFIIGLGMSFLGCQESISTGPDPRASWMFVNTTGVNVLLNATIGNNILPPSDTIKAFGSISYKHEDNFIYSGPEVYARFQFLGETPTCITFSGAIVDSLDDIRLSTNFLNPQISSGYVYLIDSALLAKSVPCN